MVLMILKSHLGFSLPREFPQNDEVKMGIPEGTAPFPHFHHGRCGTPSAFCARRFSACIRGAVALCLSSCHKEQAKDRDQPDSSSTGPILHFRERLASCGFEARFFAQCLSATLNGTCWLYV